MLTIHVWPRRLKEFLLSHPLYKSPFDFFAASIGNRDVAGRLAGDRRGRLFVEVGDGFNPEIGDEGVVVAVELASLVADGGDKAGAAVERDARPYQDGIECRDGAEGVGAAVGRALGADIVKQEDELLLRRSGVIAPYQRVFVEIVGRQNSSARK